MLLQYFCFNISTSCICPFLKEVKDRVAFVKYNYLMRKWATKVFFQKKSEILKGTIAKLCPVQREPIHEAWTL